MLDPRDDVELRQLGGTSALLFANLQHTYNFNESEGLLLIDLCTALEPLEAKQSSALGSQLGGLFGTSASLFILYNVPSICPTTRNVAPLEIVRFPQ